MLDSQAKRVAAFYDVDGTLIKTNVIHAYAFYAVNSPSIADKLRRTSKLVASLPLYWVADKIDRKLFNDAFYQNYKGFSEDRLAVLGDELFENVIRSNIFNGAKELIKRSKERGHIQVLITGAIDWATYPLAHYLGIEHVMANHLQVMDGICTGELQQPMIAGANKAVWLRQFAHQHNIDLERSFAYADSESDIPLLSSVGNPSAVNPDRGLRLTANAYQWPILHFS